MNSYQNIGKYGTYLSAYGIAVKRGYRGTEQEWLLSLKGEPGQRVELRYAPEKNMLQWRYIEGDWQDLMELSQLQTELQLATIDQMEASLRQGGEIQELTAALMRTAEAHAEAAGEAAGRAQLQALGVEQSASDARQSAGDAENARVQGALSRQAAEQAKQGSQAAARDAADAALQAQSAETAAGQQALAAQSWAVGGTGTRENEDGNNARYWAQQAAGAFAGGVLSFRGRSGYVTPESGDYTAEMVGADPAGAAQEVAGELGAALGTQGEALSRLETEFAGGKTALAGHAAGTVSGAAGAHGLRYDGGELAWYDGDTDRWRPLPLGGGSVYTCTGDGDDVAISGLVNGFFARLEETEELSQSFHLTVRGSVGLRAAPAFGTGTAGDPFHYFSFRGHAGARVTLDWSEADFPDTLAVPGPTVLFSHDGGGVFLQETLCVSLTGGTVAPPGDLTLVSAAGGARVHLRDAVLRDGGISAHMGYFTVLYTDLAGSLSCRGLTAQSDSLSAMFVNEGGTLRLEEGRLKGHKALHQTGGSTEMDGSGLWMEREGMTLLGGSLSFRQSTCHASSTAYNNGALILQEGSEALLCGSRVSSGSQFAVSLSGSSSLHAADTEIYCGDNWASFGIAAAHSTLALQGCLVEGATGITDLGGNEISVSGSRCIGIQCGMQNIGGSVIGLTDSLFAGRSVAAGEEDPYYHGYEDGVGFSLENTAADVTKLTATGCRFRGYRCGDSAGCEGYGLRAAGGAGKNLLTLTGCVFDAPPLKGRVQSGALRLGDYDEAAPRHAVLGCMFYTPDILVDGKSVTDDTATGGYMPAGANFFDVPQ